jgi:hypothetical protein
MTGPEAAPPTQSGAAWLLPVPMPLCTWRGTAFADPPPAA